MYSSSIAVYGDRLSSPNICVTDQLPEHEEDVYAQSKLDTEPIIMASKLEWTIFRLTAIMGVKNQDDRFDVPHASFYSDGKFMSEDTARP